MCLCVIKKTPIALAEFVRIRIYINVHSPIIILNFPKFFDILRFLRLTRETIAATEKKFHKLDASVPSVTSITLLLRTMPLPFF